MKKQVLLVLTSLLLVGCGGIQKNSSNNISASESITSNDSFISSFYDSKESASSLFSSTSSSNISSSSNIEEPIQVIDGETAQELIIYASSVDTVKAKSSVDMLLAKGFDNGIRYEQNQTVNYTSYSNDTTIGEGNLTHVQQGKTYSDTFSHLKMIKDFTYIDAKAYKNKVFTDSTQKENLMLSNDPSSAYAEAMKMISCGAGYVAFEDFYYMAITLGSDVFYEAYYEQDTRLHIIFYAEASNEQSNQQFIGQYDYYFTSKDEGFLNEYHAEQAFYSYDKYITAEDPSALEPMYYGKEIIKVTEGNKTQFTGKLPIDIDSTFVKSITLSAKITTIEIDELVAIKAVVEPKTATDKSLHWASSNESVARVDYTGRVTGISEGTCTIYAYNFASGVQGKIDIKVIAKHALDAGDDSTKGDLKEALELAENQYITIERIYHETIVGMLIDEDEPLNGEELSKLSISSFAYNEVTRTATYVGDLKALENIIPFLDNGNDNLSNMYALTRSTQNIYKDNILGMEIMLDAQNRIELIHFKMRTDSVKKPNGLNVQTLTDANVATVLGAFDAGYSRSVYYESKGFYGEENEETL